MRFSFRIMLSVKRKTFLVFFHVNCQLPISLVTASLCLKLISRREKTRGSLKGHMTAFFPHRKVSFQLKKNWHSLTRYLAVLPALFLFIFYFFHSCSCTSVRNFSGKYDNRKCLFFVVLFYYFSYCNVVRDVYRKSLRKYYHFC